MNAIDDFDTYVRSLIEARGLTMSQFIAAAHGTSDSTGNVYPILNGASSLTEAKAAKWAAVLGVTATDLLRANRPVMAARAAGEIRGTKKPKPPEKRRYTTTFGPYLEGVLARRGMHQLSLALAIGLKNSGDINSIANGVRPLTEGMAERWATVLEVPAAELLEANRTAQPLAGAPRKKTKKIKKIRATSAWPQMARVEQKPKQDPLTGVATDPLRRAPVASPERFSLIVNDDGTANMRLNIPDLPIDLALKLISELGLPDLLNNPT